MIYVNVLSAGLFALYPTLLYNAISVELSKNDTTLAKLSIKMK